MIRTSAFVTVATLTVAINLAAQNTRDSAATQVDRAFAAFNGTDVPGCAVGVSRGGRTVLFVSHSIALLLGAFAGLMGCRRGLAANQHIARKGHFQKIQETLAPKRHRHRIVAELEG